MNQKNLFCLLLSLKKSQKSSNVIPSLPEWYPPKRCSSACLSWAQFPHQYISVMYWYDARILFGFATHALDISSDITTVFRFLQKWLHCSHAVRIQGIWWRWQITLHWSWVFDWKVTVTRYKVPKQFCGICINHRFFYVGTFLDS